MRELNCWYIFRCYVFFSSVVKQLNRQYPALFPFEDEESVQERERSSEEGRNNETDGGDETNSFGNKWQWISWVSQVSKELGINWFEVYKLKITIFLNVICFLIDKSNEERRQIEAWKRKH